MIARRSFLLIKLDPRQQLQIKQIYPTAVSNSRSSVKREQMEFNLIKLSSHRIALSKSKFAFIHLCEQIIKCISGIRYLRTNECDIMLKIMFSYTSEIYFVSEILNHSFQSAKIKTLVLHMNKKHETLYRSGSQIRLGKKSHS